MGTRKFLYSPGYGAGWSSWATGEIAKFILFYKPIIEFLESDGKLTTGGSYSRRGKRTPEAQNLLNQLHKDIKTKFGDDAYFCDLGFDQLQVGNVDGMFKISEYDGSESYQTPSDEQWY